MLPNVQGQSEGSDFKCFTLNVKLFFSYSVSQFVVPSAAPLFL